MRSLRVCVVLALLALTAACGDDSDNAEPSATTAPTSGEGPASGEPIRVGTLTTALNLPAATAGAEAAIAAINEAGGIDGRPIELVACDNETDPNKAIACARQFAGDSSMVATVGILSNYGGDTNPILEAADLAGIGTATVAPGDYTSPIVFPTSLSTLSILGASSFLYDQHGSTAQGIAMIDAPGGVALEGQINENVLEPRDTKFSAAVAIPYAAADVTPQAAALGDTDGTVVALTPDLAIRYVQAARQQGYASPMVVVASQLTASQIEESLGVGDLTEELYAVGAFDYDSPGWQRLLAEAEANGADLKLVNDTFAVTWLSVQLFAHVANQVETIDRASILAAMNQVSDFDTEGMTAEPLDFTVDGEVLGGEAPNVIPSLQYVFVYKFEGGEYVSAMDGAQPIFEAA